MHASGVVTIPAALARNAVVAWGDEGRAFLDRLPRTVAEVARDWGLTLGLPYPMSYHWVCGVRQADGHHAVLKLGPPAAPHLAQEVAALRHFGGHGSVRLLAHDPARGALLLERALPGTAASTAVPERDIVATAAIITVMHRLHAPPVEPLPLPGLRERDERSFVDHLRRYPADTPFPRRLVTRALGLLTELCSDAAPSVVLHGDLHHDNVLRASDGRDGAPWEPWLAIDPHGVVGDPVAEVGAMLYNPDPPRRDPALVALVPARVEQLADGLGVAQERVAAWAFVQAVLSEVWTAEDPGAPVTRALDVALALEPRLG